MKIQLVLVRHGKAEDRTLFKDDAARPLTAAGEQELMDIMPHLRLFVPSNQDIRIWSSPLPRAVQTAAILADIFKSPPVSVYDFISQGDWAALADELVKIQPPLTVIIVGHEPHLSEWSDLISGCQLPFKKGAAAGYKLTSLYPLEGDLRWFVQPGVLKKLTRL